MRTVYDPRCRVYIVYYTKYVESDQTGVYLYIYVVYCIPDIVGIQGSVYLTPQVYGVYTYIGKGPCGTRIPRLVSHLVPRQPPD